MGSAGAVCARELRSEWRTRAAFGATVLFALSMLAALAFTLALKTVSTDVKAALLWSLLLFTAATGLARVYLREEELGTADALRLAAPATAVHAGKLLFNILLLSVVQVISTALFFIMLPLSTNAAFDGGLFARVSILGSIGLATGATFVAALIAQSPSSGGARSALFFVAAFPVLLPVLRATVLGTAAAFAPLAQVPGTGYNSLVMLGCYDVVVLAASLTLIGVLWSE